MGWSDWPYWMKGGVIGFIIGSLAIVMTNFLGFLFNGSMALLGLLIGIGSWPPLTIIFGSDYGFILWLTPITYFVYGAIIGWVYGKIKNMYTSK